MGGGVLKEGEETDFTWFVNGCCWSDGGADGDGVILFVDLF